MTINYPIVVGPVTLGQYSDYNVTSFDANFNMQSSTRYYSMPMMLNDTQQINDVGIYINAVSGTSSLYLVSLRALENTGDPSTTINYGGSTGTPYFASQFVKGWNWIPLGIPATGTVGGFCAPHIICITGSATDYIAPTSAWLFSSEFPRIRSDGGNSFHHPPMAIRYADGTVQGMPIVDLERLSVTTSTTPDEYGMKFTVPVDMTCIGAMFSINAAANASLGLLLYQDEDVIRVANIADEDYLMLTPNEAPSKVYFDPVDLVTDTVYRLVFQPTSGQSILPYILTLVTGTYAYVFPGGDSWQATYRSNSGTFTDDPTKRVWAGILISHISPSTGTTTVISGGGTSAYAWSY